MQYQMEQAQEELQKKAERLGRLTEEKRQLEKQLAHLEEEITGYKVNIGVKTKCSHKKCNF